MFYGLSYKTQKKEFKYVMQCLIFYLGGVLNYLNTFCYYLDYSY